MIFNLISRRPFLTIATCIAFGAYMDTPAHSEPASCGTIGQLAETLVGAKYSGVPLSDIVSSFEANSEPGQKALIGLAILACGQPDYVTEKSQKRTAREFRNMVEMTCYRERQREN